MEWLLTVLFAVFPDKTFTAVTTVGKITINAGPVVHAWAGPTFIYMYRKDEIFHH